MRLLFLVVVCAFEAAFPAARRPPFLSSFSSSFPPSRRGPRRHGSKRVIVAARGRDESPTKGIVPAPVSEDDGEETAAEAIMPPLDEVLRRARGRYNAGSLIARFQAFGNSPLWIVRIPSTFDTLLGDNNDNRGGGKKDDGSAGPSSPASTWSTLAIFKRIDGLLVLAALGLHANGFALAWVAGKLTIGPLMSVLKPPPPVQVLLLQSWPILCAIGLDQILPWLTMKT